MINVFAVFTGKLLQTLQNSSFHKTCYLEAKTNALHNFAMASVILSFLKIVMINVFAVFTGKLLQTLQNSSFHKTCYLEAKTNVLHNFEKTLYFYLF